MLLSVRSAKMDFYNTEQSFCCLVAFFPSVFLDHPFNHRAFDSDRCVNTSGMRWFLNNCRQAKAYTFL